MDALKKAIRSGLNGYKAMSLQVVSLMWLRTIINYQYKNGGTFKEVLLKLYKEGGIPRFYSGFIPALIQGPLCRFGDTFSNSIILNLLNKVNLPIFLKTFFASITAGCVRIIITPIDTIKTISQCEGKEGIKKIKTKIKEKGIISLYDGAIENGILSLIGHYPWFLMHNYLDKYIPKPKESSILLILLRNAFIGFCSTCFSDTISNSIRVIKVSVQTADKKKTYKEIIKEIIEKDGIKGVFFRGFSTKIITNGIQGITFNMLWKYFSSKESKINKIKGLKA